MADRYIVCQLDFGENRIMNIPEYVIHSVVKDALEEAHGDYGVSLLTHSLNVKYFNPLTKIIVIRAKRSGHHLILTSLPFVKQIKGRDVCFKTLHVGGTIRSCQKFIARFQRKELVELMGNTTDEAKRQVIQSSLLELLDVI